MDGMAFASEREQGSFTAAHPDLYDRSGGPARLRIRQGRLQLGSLRCPGHSVAGETDFASLRAMPDAPKGRIVGANAKTSA
jgi:hypothetical protein